VNAIAAMPVLDGRRRAELAAMLQQLVPAVLPDWHPGAVADVAQALLSIAASLEAEVTQRLDRVPEKQFRNFLDWIGIRRGDARAAGLSVVFLAAPGGAATVLAPPRQRLQAQPPAQAQAQAQSGPIVFETQQDLLVVPGTLADLVAVDGGGDKIYLPPLGVLAPAAPPSVAGQRVLAGPAAALAVTVQITPALGVAPGQSIGIGGREYRITGVKQDLISLDPPLDAAADANTAALPVTSLVPFPPGAVGDVAARDWQFHALYIGATDLLDIESDATIVVDGGDLLAGATWSYWGQQQGGSAPPDWLPFDTTAAAGTLTLAKRQVPSTLPQTTLFGQNSRWLRATLAAPQAPTTLPDGIRLSVVTQASQSRPVHVDALANSVPLVVTTQFYPLGREPRHFDQFYVSAPEAMTKNGAAVTLTFNAADESFGSLVPAEGVAFGVRNDGVLVQISPSSTSPTALTHIPIDAPVAPGQQPQPGVSAQPVSLDPSWAPSVAVWEYAAFPAYRAAFVVVVSQEKQVWMWRGWNPVSDHYTSIQPNNGWVLLDAPQGTLGPVGIALTIGATPQLVVLAAVDDNLHTRTLSLSDSTPPATGWQTGASLGGPKIAQIAVARRPVADLSEQVVLVDESNHLWLLDTPSGTNKSRVSNVTAVTTMRPAILWLGPDQPTLVSVDPAGVPFAITLDPNTPSPVAEPDGRRVADNGGFGLFQEPVSNQLIALFRPFDAPRAMVAWPIGDAALPNETITEDADLQGPPVAVQVIPAAAPPKVVLLAPATNRAVYYRDWVDPEELSLQATDLRDGVRLQLAPGTFTLLESLPGDPHRAIYGIEVSIALDGDHVFRPAVGLAAAAAAGRNWRLLQPQGAVLTGSLTGDQLTPATGDTLAANDVIVIGSQLAAQDYANALSFTVRAVAAGVAQLDPVPAAGGTVSYQHVQVSPIVQGTILPTLANVPQDKQHLLLDRGLLADATPARQTVRGAIGGNFLVLMAPWTTPPVPVGGQIDFAIPPAPPAPWASDQPPAVANPELSWEYWNGDSWWLLNHDDQTRNLRQSGKVTFTVPSDLAPTDVAGRNQQWIRARLIGGDYGKEVYLLSAVEGQSQTAERDTSQIHPPRMLSLQVGYQLDTALPPDFVITTDSRAVRDQSEANRLTAAAAASVSPSGATTSRPVVTAFEPVAHMLAAFVCPDPTAAAGRALFFGIQSGVAPTEGVIRLLALAREQQTDTRLIAETLRDGAFVQLPLDDGTFGLAQNGLLSISLDAPLQLAALFGGERYWLRLRPRPDDPGLATWQPVLDGLYLNAVTADAAVTQDLEVLGSSDGSPNQRVTLARLPVLAGSLDLRVLEPLADEDIAALRIGNPDRVRTDLPGRPGAWVRWDEIGDVADAGIGDRVYALDPATGDIFFGDGRAGLVPPVGRDAIIALSYRQVGDATANAIGAWSSLDLVTTLTGVSGAVAPLPAAGGADPASDAATLADAPDALRDRQRALTGDDLVAITLADTPEFVQARFLDNGAPRLIVVASGPDPRPNRAQRQALQARLATAALPRLSRRGGISIEPPQLRPLAITAELTVTSLDIGGTVEEAARGAIEALLDPATGGLDGAGWPLGILPGEPELMAVLVDTDGLVGVDRIDIADIGATGALESPPRVAQPDELATLAADRLVLKLSPAAS
jgi:hypothetical protein